MILNYMKLQTINYKNFYGSFKLFQETLKCYLGLKSAKHYVLQRGTRSEKFHNTG